MVIVKFSKIKKKNVDKVKNQYPNFIIIKMCWQFLFIKN